MIPKALVSASIKPIILSILVEGEDYGYNIIQHICDLSDGKLACTTGTLYPLLHGMENEGLLEATWRSAENAPRRKYYRLTSKGHAALKYEKRQWLDVTRILLQLWGSQPELALG